MNWEVLTAEQFRQHLDQGKELTVLGGGKIIVNDKNKITFEMQEHIVGTYLEWKKNGLAYLRHEVYYSGRELHFINVNNRETDE